MRNTKGSSAISALIRDFENNFSKSLLLETNTDLQKKKSCSDLLLPVTVDLTCFFQITILKIAAGAFQS